MRILISQVEGTTYLVGVADADVDPADAIVWTPGHQDRALEQAATESFRAPSSEANLGPRDFEHLFTSAEAHEMVELEATPEWDDRIAETVAAEVIRLSGTTAPNLGLEQRDEARLTQFVRSASRVVIDGANHEVAAVIRTMITTGDFQVVGRRCPHGRDLGSCTTPPCSY